MAGSPIFDAVRRVLKLAVEAARPGAPPVDDVLEMRERFLSKRVEQLTRRRFLEAAAFSSLALAGGEALFPRAAWTHPASGSAKIVIVGAGIAGLNAAYKLQKAGLRAEIYEASERTGGRILTVKDVLGPGLTTELGGEFIDSTHLEMRALAKEFGLELLDTRSASESALIRPAFFFNGSQHTEAEAVEAFKPLAERIRHDVDTLGKIINYQHSNDAAKRLDALSLAQYLDKIGASGWMRKLLDVAFVTEYGLDANEQSALNFILMINTNTSKHVVGLYGSSDERYKVKGGNQRVVDELARRLEGQIHPRHQLKKIGAKDKGFRLTFENPNGSAVDVDGDVVVMCIPFSTLRDVDIRLELPPEKKKTIAELGYGQNAKVCLGFKQRYWRAKGFSGYLFSEEPIQCAWDSSQLQQAAGGSLTVFNGGTAGLDLAKGSPQEAAARLLPFIEKAFPGASQSSNGQACRFEWPTYQWTKGSYSCYKPGQWTSIHGAEGTRFGALYFAGEHCSEDFQAYMNGGAQTGKDAAAAVVSALGARATA